MLVWVVDDGWWEWWWVLGWMLGWVMFAEMGAKNGWWVLEWLVGIGRVLSEAGGIPGEVSLCSW